MYLNTDGGVWGKGNDLFYCGRILVSSTGYSPSKVLKLSRGNYPKYGRKH